MNKQIFNGLKVIDVATLIAAPLIATMFSDYGAEVIKVEHPKGDPLRGHGYTKNGIPLLWKMINRNKKCITLNLGKKDGSDLLKKLIVDADILVENFRPGTMERWGLGWDVLHNINPKLIMVRVTGFGQKGPYSQRPGFGTLAEAMSGFAHLTGEENGPPTLPPFGLADGICAMAATWATAFALYNREMEGVGQYIDMAIYEPILTILGAQPTFYDQLGIIEKRGGNRSKHNAPRNTYRTKDGRWVAISTSSLNIAKRVMELVGNPEVTNEPWFQTGKGRVEHVEELDEIVGSWIAQHDFEEVMVAFEEAEAAIAPVYDISQVMQDPHFNYRKSITEVTDSDFSSIKMQNVIAKFSSTPGNIRWAGLSKGANNDEIFKQLGLSQKKIDELKVKEII